MTDRPRLLIVGAAADLLAREVGKDGRCLLLPHHSLLSAAPRLVGLAKPDLVLLDAGDTVGDAVRAVEQIALQAPYLTSVVLCEQLDTPLAAVFLEAGANGLLTAPAEPGVLVESLLALHQKVQARKRHWVQQRLELVDPRRPRLVALFSSKGGVGKTTLAVNLSVALSLLTEQETILLDADLEAGDAAVVLDVRPKRSVVDFSKDLAAAAAGSFSGYLTQHSCGIRLLAAPPAPEEAEQVHPSHVRAALDEARNLADYVVADTAPSYSQQVLTVLEHADTIILPVTPDIASLKNARNALEVLRDLQVPADRQSVVLNRCGSNVGLSQKEIESVLERPVLSIIPNDPRTVTAATNAGRPFVFHSPDVAVSRAVMRTAEQLLDRWSPRAATASRRPQPFWKRLFGTE
jgi:pilus assembly protein CpaE